MFLALFLVLIRKEVELFVMAQNYYMHLLKLVFLWFR